MESSVWPFRHIASIDGDIVRMALRISIALDTILSRTGETLYARASTDEAVMMSVTAGRYYGLNAVALRIWELLERPATIGWLCARLCEEFEVDAQTCEAEVLKFVNELIDNGIVHAAAA
ncbi:MAG: PqqD family peptide modification chaperone [Methylocella sp.]